MSDGEKDQKEKDEAKAIVLARRARFVAAAVASVGIACGKSTTPPEPCLSATVQPDAAPLPCLSPMPADAGREAPPMPCLSQPMPTSTADAAADAGKPPNADAGAKPLAPDAGAHRRPTGPGPVPCLSVAPKTPSTE